MTKNVLVVGGGIAGTVAAIALHRTGWQPRIVEARPPDADERGAFLTVATNGLAALRALGLDPEELLAAGYPTPTLVLANGAGRRLGVLPLGGPTADGTTTTTIRRADLYAALRGAAARDGIPITYERRLSGLDTGSDIVTATFDDGTTARADLLVGADGIGSRTRRLLDPHAPAPTYLGLLNAGGFTDGPIGTDRATDLDTTPGRVHMTFGRRAFFGWSLSPDGSVWWFANPPRPEPVRPGEYTPETWRAYLLDLFADDDTPACAAIRATPEVLGPWNTDDLPRVPVWQRDRVVLVGDAAHAVSPSSGQGASMAFEDAVVLARCLSGGTDPAVGLAEYEAIRRPRVEKIVAYGRRNSSSKTAGPIGAALRDAFLPTVLKVAHRRGDPQRWILEHAV